MRWTSIALAASLAAAAVAPASAPAGPAKLRVLLLSGQNNHDWKTTTPALVKIYQAAGRFDVTVTNEPAKLTAEAFTKRDVVVSNWTPWPKVKQPIWDAKTEKAFLDFVRGGRGLVVFHAACTACQSWPEFQQLVGATWAMGKTGHGRRHEFAVKIADPSHPVTAGMTEFRIFDELWHRMGTQPGVHVLCTAFSAKEKRGSGAAEAVALCTRLGKGRGFNLVLGHDVRAMSCPGWRTLMLRGTEWAATGKVTIPVVAGPPAGEAAAADVEAALKALYGYKLGGSRQPLWAVRRLVQAAAATPAARKKASGALVASLAADATTDCKKFACEQLGLIGGAADVPALATLLSDKELSLAARSALERMPGAPPLAAMRAALPKATGALRVGLICSLGERADARAVEAIAAALGDKDPVAAGAAIDALGKIGGDAAVEALAAAAKKLPPTLQPVLADALLQCADRLLAAGQAERAAGLYEDLSSAGRPKHVRVAAFPGLVACRRDKAAELMLAALRGKDPAMQRAAVRAVRAAPPDPALTEAIAAELPKLEPPVRAMMIEVLGDRGAAAALPAVTKEAAGEDSTVRRAALAALGKLGNASTVPLLAKLAAEATGADRHLARAALARLKGQKVDEALVAAMKASAAPVRCELIVALRDRGARSAGGVLLAAAGDPEAAVRAEALKALGKLAEASACPALIKLLATAPGESDRWNIEAALVAVCRRAGEPDAAARPVLSALAGADAKRTGSLLRVLAPLGGKEALAAIRKALKSGDAEVGTAAIRALADWPDAAPLGDLLAVAESAAEPVPKVLALRGFVKLSAKATDRDPTAMAALYARAMKLATRPDEKKALLSGLAGVHCTEALAAAEALTKEPALASEAALAVVKIADALWKSQPAAVRPALERVAAAGLAPAVRAEATRVLLELSKPRNLARDAKATSPDGWEKDGASGGDQAAIDGNPNTYWDEANGKKLYRLVVTFPEPRKVAVVRITGYQQHSYSPRDFEVLCDGKVVKAVRNAQYTDNRLTVAFAETRCTSLELKITGYYAQSPAVRELEVFGLSAAKPTKPPARMAGGPSYSWKRAAGSLALLNHEQVVWQLNTEQKANGKSCFHPLGLLDGSTITWFRPPDHPWHRALWFCWKHINGLNYWEENRKTGVSPGVTEIRSVKIEPAEDFSARIEMAIGYHPPGKADVLAERRIIQVSRPDVESSYRIDWTATFTAGKADALLKGGTSGGGYAGFSARLAAATRAWKVVNSESLRDGAAHGKKARWVAWSGEIAAGKPAGIVIFDHPGNLRHPSPWYVAVRRKQPFHYFSPALLFSEPYTLAAGKSMTLRYRTLVHPGLTEVKRIEAEWKAFGKTALPR